MAQNPSSPASHNDPAAQSASGVPGAVPPSRSGLAIAALVLGIVAAATSFLPFINNISFIIALVALALGIAGLVSVGRGGRRGKGLAIAGIILAVVSGAVVLGTQALYSAALDKAVDEANAAMDEAAAEANASLDRMTGAATDEVLANDVDVVIGAFSVEEGSYGLTDTSLPVTLTNTSDETATFNIHIEAVGADGSRIDDAYVMASDLRPGQTQDFEVFTYVPTDKLEAMQAATFEIVEASVY
ncbi:MAG: DUF4190 domain-containing protein [Eggerthellaceae bacterium]|nr:DUF4190 domain-containing protein [Eggerthellaceae bacterium]